MLGINGVGCQSSASQSSPSWLARCIPIRASRPRLLSADLRCVPYQDSDHPAHSFTRDWVCDIVPKIVFLGSQVVSVRVSDPANEATILGTILGTAWLAGRGAREIFFGCWGQGDWLAQIRQCAEAGLVNNVEYRVPNVRKLLRSKLDPYGNRDPYGNPHRLSAYHLEGRWMWTGSRWCVRGK